MGTTVNTKDIRSAAAPYANLHEELDAIHDGVSSLETGKQGSDQQLADLSSDVSILTQGLLAADGKIATLEQTVDNLELNVETVQEVVEARDGHPDLKTHLDAIKSLSIWQENLKLTTRRDYAYSPDGLILSETLSGDTSYQIRYFYTLEGEIDYEEHWKDGILVGTKTYEYDPDLGYITAVISDKADDFQLIYNDTTTKDLDSRLDSIEIMNLTEQLDDIRSAILTGPYDGKTLTETVHGFNSRLQSLEQVAPGVISDIIDLPALSQRVSVLEQSLTGGRLEDEFIVTIGQSVFILSRAASYRKIKIFVDGILVDEGDDYLLGSDDRTISFNTRLLTGSRVFCEYY